MKRISLIARYNHSYRYHYLDLLLSQKVPVESLSYLQEVMWSRWWPVQTLIHCRLLLLQLRPLPPPHLLWHHSAKWGWHLVEAPRIYRIHHLYPWCLRPLRHSNNIISPHSTTHYITFD